ncbi:PqqD family protein [Peptostreptococcus russellii]|uniref:PqqD family protein n=1 Tax=Peptostreptococcus russellii TaxID=215200 RepID=UPI0026EB813E|nr:PqqD family protein [Peptostreptococcus russellii]
METNEDVLNIVYKKNEGFNYETDENGIITVLEKQDHWIQRLFRKIGFRIPKYKRTELDKFGSFIVKQVDGEKTVEEIGVLLSDEFGEEANPLYERLLLFLNYIDVDCNYIERIAQ